MSPLRGATLAWFLLLALVWGVAFMFISVGLQFFSPVLFAAFRFDIGFVVMAAVAYWRTNRWQVPRGAPQWWAVGIASVLNVAAYNALLFWGQERTTASIAAVLVGLNPLLTTVFSRTMLHDERVGPGGAFGLLLGLGGVAVLASLKPGSLWDPQGQGEVAVVLAIAAWAFGTVFIRRTRHGMDLYWFVAWQSLGGAILLHASTVVLEGGGRAEWTGAGLRALLYLSVISSAFGFVLFFHLMERIGPIRTNLVSYLTPVVATVAGVAVLDQPFEVRAVVAFLLIAGGFLLVARPAPARRQPAPESASGPAAPAGRP